MTRLHTGALCSKSSSQPSSCERGATASGAAVGATLATPATSSSVTNAGIIGCLAMSKFIACALWGHRWPAASGVRFGRFPGVGFGSFPESGERVTPGGSSLLRASCLLRFGPGVEPYPSVLAASAAPEVPLVRVVPVACRGSVRLAPGYLFRVLFVSRSAIPEVCLPPGSQFPGLTRFRLSALRFRLDKSSEKA